MRDALVGLAVIAVVGAGACTMAQAAPSVSLICETRSPQAQRLCAAVHDELLRRGHVIAPDAPMQLVLIADATRRDEIQASMDVILQGQRQRGQTGTLTVMDRAELPTAQIESFARTLLDKAGVTSH